MSVGRQFKRIGETGVAFGLWGLILWIITDVKRLLIALVVVVFLFSQLMSATDDTNRTLYVNAKTLKLLDKPFGKVVKTLKMNDTLVLVRKMSDDWKKVAIGEDTLFFKGSVYSEISRYPFTKWDALEGHKVKVSHPDGFYEAEESMLKNGDIITVTSSTEYDVRFEKGKNSTGYGSIPKKYLIINWNKVLRKYPNAI